MTHFEHPNHSTLTWELRDVISQLIVPERPPLTAITDRGRAHHRRRLTGLASLGIATAAAMALAFGLTGTLSANPGRSTGATRATPPTSGTKTRPGTSHGTIRTPDFILTSNVNGTDTLTLTMNQVLDPSTLQQALAAHGIPALVKSGTYCTSSPAPPDPVKAGVLSVSTPSGIPHTMVPAPNGPAPSEVTEMAARTVTVINPAAIPAGTELFFGYSSNIHAVFTDLIYTNSFTCSSNPQPA